MQANPTVERGTNKLRLLVPSALRAPAATHFHVGHPDLELAELSMRVPGTDFLDRIEHLYSVKYPRKYRELCAQLEGTEIEGTGYGSRGTNFIADLETFWAVNVRSGEQQWGDYERAIAGKRHPKDKNRLWGEILPFFVDDHCVYGFSNDGSTDDQVHVWSVHTIVHSYPSLSAFAEAHLRV